MFQITGLGQNMGSDNLEGHLRLINEFNFYGLEIWRKIGSPRVNFFSHFYVIENCRFTGIEKASSSLQAKKFLIFIGSFQAKKKKIKSFVNLFIFAINKA